MTMNYPCPCCGYKTYSEKANGDYIICPVCFREDDPIQIKDSGYAGGANTFSLKQAQNNFLLFGACTKEMIKNVRLPKQDELRDESWEPFDKK